MVHDEDFITVNPNADWALESGSLYVCTIRARDISFEKDTELRNDLAIQPQGLLSTKYFGPLFPDL